MNQSNRILNNRLSSRYLSRYALKVENIFSTKRVGESVVVGLCSLTNDSDFVFF